MERAEAQAIYEQGREAVVAVLLALSARLAAQDAQSAQLATRVAELEQRLNRRLTQLLGAPLGRSTLGAAAAASSGLRPEGRRVSPVIRDAVVIWRRSRLSTR